MMVTEPGLPLEAENLGTLMEYICFTRLNQVLNLGGEVNETFKSRFSNVELHGILGVTVVNAQSHLKSAVQISCQR